MASITITSNLGVPASIKQVEEIWAEVEAKGQFKATKRAGGHFYGDTRNVCTMKPGQWAALCGIQGTWKGEFLLMCHDKEEVKKIYLGVNGKKMQSWSEYGAFYVAPKGGWGVLNTPQ